MFLLLGFFVFLIVLSLSFALTGRALKNPLLEIGAEKVQRPSEEKPFLDRLWALDENSPLSSEAALTVGLAAGLLGFLLGGLFGDWLIGSAVGLFFFVFAPRLACSVVLKHRIKAFRDTFEFGLEILLTALGIGMPLKDALMEASRNSPEPVKTEFARVSAEIAVGVPEEEAFRNLAKRIPCSETEELLDAIGLYKNVGGSKALDLLRAVLTNLRERMNADFQVRQQTKGAKTSAVIVALIPVAYFSVMLMIAPDLFGPLISTDFGRSVAFISLLIMGFGAWLIVDILRNIEQF
jgi:tight adherence protein B